MSSRDFDIFSAEFIERDPTWRRALQVVSDRLPVPVHVNALLRNAWNRQCIEARDFIRVLGFSRLNISCLFAAAEINLEKSEANASLVTQALTMLGPRLTATILGVNLSCHAILAAKPPPLWRNLLREMMCLIEIGYRLGSYAQELGIEGGVVAGFGHSVGVGLLLAHDASRYKAWVRRTEPMNRDAQAEYFGCEVYQVAALAIQRLGFGTDTAIGIALAGGSLRAEHVTLTNEIKMWKAASEWVRALRDARNFPSDPEMRTFFPQLIPPDKNEKNLALEVLHTEVGRIRQHGSAWTWHLPKPDYEATAAYLGLP